MPVARKFSSITSEIRFHRNNVDARPGYLLLPTNSNAIDHAALGDAHKRAADLVKQNCITTVAHVDGIKYRPLHGFVHNFRSIRSERALQIWRNTYRQANLANRAPRDDQIVDKLGAGDGGKVQKKSKRSTVKKSAFDAFDDEDDDRYIKVAFPRLYNRENIRCRFQQENTDIAQLANYVEDFMGSTSETANNQYFSNHIKFARPRVRQAMVSVRNAKIARIRRKARRDKTMTAMDKERAREAAEKNTLVFDEQDGDVRFNDKTETTFEEFERKWKNLRREVGSQLLQEAEQVIMARDSKQYVGPDHGITAFGRRKRRPTRRPTRHYQPGPSTEGFRTRFTASMESLIRLNAPNRRSSEKYKLRQLLKNVLRRYTYDDLTQPLLDMAVIRFVPEQELDKRIDLLKVRRIYRQATALGAVPLKVKCDKELSALLHIKDGKSKPYR